MVVVESKGGRPMVPTACLLTAVSAAFTIHSDTSFESGCAWPGGEADVATASNNRKDALQARLSISEFRYAVKFL